MKDDGVRVVLEDHQIEQLTASPAGERIAAFSAVGRPGLLLAQVYLGRGEMVVRALDNESARRVFAALGVECAGTTS